jgi:putative redox protein
MGVEMSIEYRGGLHCELVHGPSSSHLETDAPRDNMGKGEAFSPTDLVGAALASCAITTMAIKAAKEHIPFTSATGRVTKTMSSEGPRRIAELTLEIALPASLPAAHRARLEEIAHTCPVALSLSKDVALPMTFRYDL